MNRIRAAWSAFKNPPPTTAYTVHGELVTPDDDNIIRYIFKPRRTTNRGPLA